MRARGGTLFLICAALVALAVPGVAAAQAKPEVRPGSFATGFQLQGSHDYDLSVVAVGHRQVQLTASRGQVSATYTTRGRASRKGIEADFGSLGKIAVRFEGAPIPRKNRGKSQRTCKGRKAIRERGAFHGTIRFVGENGFTEVDADRARGRFQRSFRRVCRRISPPQPAFKPPRLPKLGKLRFQNDTLLVGSKLGDSSTTLILSSSELRDGPGKEGSFGFAVVVAGREERIGPVSINRSTFMIGDGSVLRMSEPRAYPIVAIVKLPKPFTGTATYREEKGVPPSWTGPLGVRLPGAGLVPLTGEGFEPSLCRASTPKAYEACLRQLSTSTAQASVFSLLQGSGSQSQAFWDARLSWSR